MVLQDSEIATLRLPIGPGTITLAYPSGDPYWSRYVSNIHAREPEIWFVVKRFLSPDTVFIDGGANIGLWSCIAASKIMNPEFVIAVEPADYIGRLLQKNQALNGNGFQIIPRAVWNKSGEQLWFHEYTSHVSSSVIPSANDKTIRRNQYVASICVDDIVAGVLEKAPSINNVVIKLDVEGVEREALQGAVHTMRTRNALVIYEDHRTHDPNSETTAAFLNFGLNIYHVDTGTERPYPITDASQLTPIKSNPSRKGYNFIGCPPGSAFDLRFKSLCDENTVITPPVGPECSPLDWRRQHRGQKIRP